MRMRTRVRLTAGIEPWRAAPLPHQPTWRSGWSTSAFLVYVARYANRRSCRSSSSTRLQAVAKYVGSSSIP
jgi:hypothetical protein